MIINELESGFYLDLSLQRYILKIFITSPDSWKLVDELHAEDQLPYLNQITYFNSPYRNKTIWNPELEKVEVGTNIGTGSNVLVPVEGAIQYRLSFFKFKGIDLCRIQNITENKISFIIRSRDFNFWNLELSEIKRKYYVSAES